MKRTLIIASMAFVLGVGIAATLFVAVGGGYVSVGQHHEAKPKPACVESLVHACGGGFGEGHLR